MIISASAFNLLCYVLLVDVYEENEDVHKYIACKGSGILIPFSYNCEYSLSLFHKNSISDR